MPFVTISATPGLSAEQKKQLLLQTSQAVVDTFNAPVSSVRVMFHELLNGHYIAAGQFDTPTVMFEVDLIGGRPEEDKAALIARLGKVAHETTGVPEDEVRARLTDFPTTNMGMAGGITAKQAGR